MRHWFFVLALAVAIPLALPSNVGAVAVNGVAQNVPYVIGFHVMNSSSHPFLGQMHLNFNNGIISGTYTDISVRPGGPLANVRNAPVSGGISSSHVSLHIRSVTFRGTMSGDKMSGSSTINGTVYVFEAHPGSPGSGA